MAMKKRQKKIIYPPPRFVLCLTLSKGIPPSLTPFYAYATAIAPSSVIRLLHLCAIPTNTVRFLRPKAVLFESFMKGVSNLL